MPTRPLPAERQRALFLQLVMAATLLVAALVLFPFVSKMLSGGDEFTRHTNMGKNYYDRGEAAKAVAALEQARKLQPANADALVNLANAHLLAGQPARALATAQEALQLDHNLAAAHYVIGCAHLRQGQFEPAAKALQEAKKLAEPPQAAVSFQLALAHLGLNQAEDALREFQEAIDLEPEHPAAHYRLSQLLLRAGRQAEAEKALETHRQIAAKKPGAPADAATYERCQLTEIRAPFKLEQPARRGVPVMFTDATAAAFGHAAGFQGPVGVLDLDHDGRNSLFVVEGGDGFRVLVNSNGVFRPKGDKLPGVAGAGYRRMLVGELHTDRFEDVIVLGEKASHVFKFVTNAGITEVTRFAGLKDLTARDGALVDLDFTGKLDLLTLAPDGAGTRAFRNLGSFYFRDNTATSGLPAALTGARQMVLDDWNSDDLADVFLAREGQPVLLVTKLRGGPLTATNSPADWPAGSVIATGDLNNDLRTDLAVAGPDAIEIVFNGGAGRARLPLAGFKVTVLKLVDYDNDGWLDVIAAGAGLRTWRNAGQGGFRDATRELGLDALGGDPIASITAADFDGDCDTDLLLSLDGAGLRLLRNDGGNANHQLKVRLIGHRSNPSGLGMRLELASGGLRMARTVSQLPLEIGVGRHEQLESLTIRWFDLAVNSVDVKVECARLLAMEEIQLPTGSCPYLYAWDGQRFRFVTDLLGAAPAGLPVAEGRYVDADTDEHVWLGAETMFPPRDGFHVAQITEELREVLYLDEAKLVVVDHPAGTEVHTTSKLRPAGPFPPPEIVTLHHRRLLLRAVNQQDADVTARLQEADGLRVSPTALRVPQLRGLAELHSVTLDFGPLDATRPLVLALTGWLRFGGGMANIAASHHPDLPFPFPTLEAETADGAWQPVNVVVGAPAGKTKTILVELAGKLPAGARRLRLGTAFEVHWDRIALFERRDNAETRVAVVAPAVADLHWRGFSEFADLPWTQPLTPVYERVRPTANWRLTPSGWCTRYGDVGELIVRKDNALALLNGGDELTLKFAAAELPPKPAGAVRDFFLFTSGWDKDADFHVAAGTTVEPLPWHGMDDQRYGRQPRPAFTNDAWITKYNTRWVGPQTLARQARP
jgi:Flp pilus assembly protein TadD